MSRVRRAAGAATLAVACHAWIVGADTQSARPLPEPEALYAAARDNLTRANREQHRYAYKERRTELHMNPFGRIGSGGVVIYEVTPVGPTVSLRRVLERDGKAVTDSRPERQERRPRSRGRSVVDDTVATLKFVLDRRETVDGRDAIVVRFEPRPEADPETREGRLAKVFKGTIWVDEASREVMRLEATAIDDISYGFGLLARLQEGTVVTLRRERVDAEIWLPTSIRFTGHGRAILFRKLNIDHVIEWFDYKRIL